MPGCLSQSQNLCQICQEKYELIEGKCYFIPSTSSEVQTSRQKAMGELPSCSKNLHCGEAKNFESVSELEKFWHSPSDSESRKSAEAMKIIPYFLTVP